MVYLGADHGGYKLKEKIKGWLIEWREKYEDLGAIDYNANDDYPQYAFLVAEAVVKNTDKNLTWQEQAKGILICRSASGMIIAANKIKGIRAAAAFDLKNVQMARMHNDANIIGFSGDWLDEAKAKEIIKAFLTTEFSREERHVRRIKQIMERETVISN